MDTIFSKLALELQLFDIRIDKKDLEARWDSETRSLDLSALGLLIPPISSILELKPKRLDLGMNCITSIPDSISELTDLEELYLNNNAPVVGQSFQEYGINVEEAELLIPKSIGRLKKLEVLHLGRNNIQSLPDTIGELDNLRVLEINSCLLACLPAAAGQIGNLEELYLRNNLLAQLPDELSKLEHLRLLDIRGNDITALPPHFPRLHRLERIMWDWDEIAIGTKLPMEKLDLSDQGLKHVDEKILMFDNLRSLDLSYNNLSEVPKCLYHLPDLEFVDLSGNPIISPPQQINELENKSTSPFPLNTEHSTYMLKILLGGVDGVGKTTLTDKYVYNMFKRNYISGIGVDFHIKQIEIGDYFAKIQIWDMPYSRRFGYRDAMYRGSNGGIIMFDLTRSDTLENLFEIVEKLRQNVSKPVPIVLVGNKSDLLDKREVSPWQANAYARRISEMTGAWVKYMETSPKYGEKVDEIFNYLLWSVLNPDLHYRK